MVSAEIRGLAELNKYFAQLPLRVEKELVRGNLDFMKRVRDSARRRAPKDTKALKDSITIQETKSKGKSNQVKLLVDSPYAYFQEVGFRPHWIHSDMIYGSKKLTREGFFYVQKNKPFVIPAFNFHIKKLDKLLSKSIDISIK